MSLNVLVVMVLALTSTAQAAGKDESGANRWEQKREQRMERLDEALQLSAEQKARIEAIWRKAEADAEDIRDKGALRKRKQRREWREVMQEARAQVRAVLTPEQQKIFDAMPRERNGGKAAR